MAMLPMTLGNPEPPKFLHFAPTFVDDELTFKLAWSHHVIHFKFWGPNHSSGKAEVRVVKCYHRHDISLTKGAWLWSCNTFL